jgi:SAM-dependent methyltransferase
MADFPEETFEILRRLVPPDHLSMLDVGCGIGPLSRQLAPELRVQAVDSSVRMIDVARAMPGGAHPQLTWTTGRAEEVDLNAPFGLIVAARSFHLLDWDVALPRFAAALAPAGMLAIVYLHERGIPDLRGLGRVPFPNPVSHNYDWLQTLRQRGLFERRGWERSSWRPRHVSFLDFVESRHAMRGFSREEMGWRESLEFDSKVFAVLGETCPLGYVATEVAISVVWGKPLG